MIEANFDKEKLIEFFECEPLAANDTEERDFFGTLLFCWEQSDLQLEFSVDPYTPNATIQILKDGQVVFDSTLEVSEYRFATSAETRKLIVKSKGFSTILELPAIRISVIGNS